MGRVSQVTRSLQTCLLELPAEIARESGFCQRESKFTASAFVQTMVLGWLANPTATLPQLCATAADVGVTISPQGIDQRWNDRSVALLKSVFDAAVRTVITGEPVMTPLLARFPAVVLLDSTTITLPDHLAHVWMSCGGRTEATPQAAVKATVRWDVRNGTVDGPDLSAGRRQDKSADLQHASLPAGGLRIADLGYWSLVQWQAIRAQGAHVLSRLHVQSVVMDADTGDRVDLSAWLMQQSDPQVERPILLGTDAQIPARLLAARVPAAVAEERRRTIRRDAKREGETPSRRNLERADWTIMVTSVPASDLSISEALVLLRTRWQLELLFKLWKSDGRIDEWRSQNPFRIHCELYAKLTAMIIQHWIVLTGGWDHVDRSMVHAAMVVREHATALALAIRHPRILQRHLTTIAGIVATTLRVAKRRKHPSTAQLLQNPALLGLA